MRTSLVSFSEYASEQQRVHLREQLCQRLAAGFDHFPPVLPVEAVAADLPAHQPCQTHDLRPGLHRVHPLLVFGVQEQLQAPAPEGGAELYVSNLRLTNPYRQLPNHFFNKTLLLVSAQAPPLRKSGNVGIIVGDDAPAARKPAQYYRNPRQHVQNTCCLGLFIV